MPGTVTPIGVLHTPAATDIIVRPTPPEEVVQRWPFLRGRLVEILEAQKARFPVVTWTPEHVRLALLAGQAELWLVTPEQHSHPLAFAITQTMVDQCLHVPHGLFFWFLWRDPQAPKRVITDVMDVFFSNLARSRGLLYCEGITPWDGFAKRVLDMGWHIVGYIIRKDVTPHE